MDFDRLCADNIQSETAVEDEEGDDYLDIIGFELYLTRGDLIARFMKSVKHIARLIQRTGGRGYSLAPVLIADDLVEGVEISLPKNAMGCVVKVWVDGHKLFIVGLSSGDPHGAGVQDIVGQGYAWDANRVWAKRSYSKIYIGDGPNNAFSPDLVIAIPPQFAAAGQAFGRVVIIELEVSNRNPRQMRTDLNRYFAETTVHSVVGVKFFGDAVNPGKFACAVMWSRDSGQPIRVAGAWDFGFLPLRYMHRRHFENEIAGILPAVHPHQWLQNRFIPILAEQVTPAGGPALGDEAYVRVALAYVQGLWPPQSDHVMYTAGRPFAVFPGHMLMSYLHNLPPEAPPLLEDFRLDLGKLFYAMVRDPRR